MTDQQTDADEELKSLLDAVLEHGWTDERQRAFMKRCGPLLRRSVLYQLRCHFGPAGLKAAHAYLTSLQTGHPVELDPDLGVDADSVELAINTWQDVLADVFKVDVQSSLIGKFADYRQTKRSGARSSAPSFKGFLRQSVRYKFLDNLPYKLSAKEILDRIVDLDQPDAQRHYIQLAKERFAPAVREHVRSVAPDWDGAAEANVVHYFFERFVQEVYPKLRPSFGSRTGRSDVMAALLAHMSDTHLHEGAHHHPEIREAVTSVNPSDASDEALQRVGRVDEISLADDVDRYWDLLLRCQRPSHREIERKLTAFRVDKATALCWACAKLKSESRRRDTRENVIAFIAFYCSQRGPDRPSDAPPNRDQLCLEAIQGHYLRWDEDVCRGMFQKHVRKDRVMAMIADTLADSPYGHLLPSAAERTSHD